MGILFFLMPLQAVDVTGAAQVAPDIEIRAQVSIDEVEIERDDPVAVHLKTLPKDSEQTTEVTRSAPSGQRQYQDLEITASTEIRLADPLRRAFDLQDSRKPPEDAATSEAPSNSSKEDPPE